MYDLILFIAVLLLLLATVYDLRSREIPDWISVAILILTVLTLATGQHPRGWSGAVGGLGLASLIGLGAFAIGFLGGGDVKLLASIGALLGPLGWLGMLFWIAFAGGSLAVVAALRGQRDYAYAPAIAVGFSVVALCPSATALLLGWPAH